MMCAGFGQGILFSGIVFFSVIVLVWIVGRSRDDN